MKIIVLGGAGKMGCLATQDLAGDERVDQVIIADRDMSAARANDAKYFPVNPGYEELSWELFFKEASNKFFEGDYSQKYEAKLVQKFEKLLPNMPPWK